MKHCHARKNKFLPKKLQRTTTRARMKNHFIFGVFLLMFSLSLSLTLTHLCVLSFPLLPISVHDFIEFTRDEIFKIPMFYTLSMTFTIYVDGIKLLRTIIYFICVWLLVPSNTTTTPSVRIRTHTYTQWTLRANYYKQQTKKKTVIKYVE